jgi:hypothetical protein
MNPLLIPPRLLFRALDDLHTLATAAARIDEVERRMNERIAALLELGERIEASFDERTLAIDARAEAILALGERVDQRAEAILDQGERVVAAAREVADRGETLAEALPVIQRAIEMAQPLEGAVERLGRVIDRLPGTRPQRGATPRGTS